MDYDCNDSYLFASGYKIHKLTTKRIPEDAIRMLLQWKSRCYKENGFLKAALKSSIYKSSIDSIKISKTKITDIHRNLIKKHS